MSSCSFKKIQEAILLSYDEEILDKEEFLFLYEAYSPANLTFPHTKYDRFCLVNKDPDECKADFRFEKQDIPLLVQALRMPAAFKCPNGTICDSTEALCMVLKRYAFPCRLSDMIPIFGRSVPEISMITNEVTNWIYTNHHHRITQWNHHIMSPALLEVYADAIYRKGAALDNCFGFVDGTVRPICRPGINQRMVYNGHKRIHSLKFQSVSLPNGIIGNLFGPVGELKTEIQRLLLTYNSKLYPKLGS